MSQPFANTLGRALDHSVAAQAGDAGPIQSAAMSEGPSDAETRTLSAGVPVPAHALDTLVDDDSGGPRPEPDDDIDMARGTALGRYLVLERLGAGGMGVVYAAFDPDLDRRVALKLVRPRVGQQGRGRERLLREAQALARLTHPNVVAVHDVGTVDELVFVAMEFVQGTTLRVWRAERTCTTAETLAVFMAAGRGLAAAHAQGLVHRDFKPDNVMITAEGRVVVMDFGLAARGGPRTRKTVLPILPGRAATAAAEADVAAEPAREASGRAPNASASTPIDAVLTEVGSLVGTPAYMAPEQINGAAIEAAADQFAFCVALYEALYGERPFDASSLQSLVFAVTHGHVRSEPRNADVPRWLRRVVLRGLAVRPAERWPSMDALLAALHAGSTRRRRPWWIAIGVVAVGAALVSAMRLQHARREAECDAEAQAIADTWNPARAQRLQAGFVASGASSALETHQRVVTRLDDFTREWTRARADMCRRARLDETLAPETHARAQACFDERRDQLEALLEIYEAAEAAMVPAAVKSAADLAQLDPCDDERALAQRPAPPADDATHRAVTAIRRDLARAAAFSDAGHYGDALAIARDALDRAAVVGWPTAEVEARMVAASIQAELGDYPQVVRELEIAFVRASSTGDDALAARTAITLLRVLGYHLARADEGLAWGHVAEALLVRLGRTEGLDAAALASNRGLAEQVRGHPEAALVHHRRALELREAVLGSEHPESAHSYGNIGNVQLSLARHDDALRWHTRALELRTRTLGPTHPDTARSLNNLGKVHLARGDLEAAVAQFERAHTIFEDTLGRHSRVTARVLYNLGDAWLSRGDADVARSYLERALAIQHRTLGDAHPETAQTAYRLGLSLLARQDPAAALTYLRRAEAALSRSVGDGHPDTELARAAVAVVCQAGHTPACEPG